MKVVTVKKELVDLESAYSFEGDYLPHCITVGISGSGKSSLIRINALKYIERGYTVVMREVGKFDFISRFMNTSDVLDFVESDNYVNSDKDKVIKHWRRYKEKYGEDLICVISHPSQIQKQKINLLVWDLIRDTKSLDIVIAQFYEFLRILREQRELNWEEYDLVFIIDESNDIFPTLNKNPYRYLNEKINEMCYWLRQWRGYHVRFYLSTHTTKQLNKDARSQCGLYFWKQSERLDAKEIVQKELFHLEDEEFRRVYKSIQSLQPSQTLYIDDRKNFKFFNVPFVEKKYIVKECYDFVLSFEPEHIISPIRHTWDGAMQTAEVLYKNMSEIDLKKIFSIKDEDSYLKLVVRMHQFYRFMFSFPDLKYLYGAHEFVNYITNAIMTIFEDDKGIEFLIEKEKQSDIVTKVSIKYHSEQINALQAVCLIYDANDDIPVSHISAALDISQGTVRKLRSRRLRIEAKIEEFERENPNLVYSTYNFVTDQLEKMKERDLIQDKINRLSAEPNFEMENKIQLIELAEKRDKLKIYEEIDK